MKKRQIKKPFSSPFYTHYNNPTPTSPHTHYPYPPLFIHVSINSVCVIIISFWVEYGDFFWFSLVFYFVVKRLRRELTNIMHNLQTTSFVSSCFSIMFSLQRICLIVSGRPKRFITSRAVNNTRRLKRTINQLIRMNIWDWDWQD